MVPKLTDGWLCSRNFTGQQRGDGRFMVVKEIPKNENTVSRKL
jgi:hypothetical protein